LRRCLQNPSNPDAVEQIVWLTSSGTCAIACWLTFSVVPCCNIWKHKPSVVSYLIAYLLTVCIVPEQGIRANRVDVILPRMLVLIYQLP